MVDVTTLTVEQKQILSQVSWLCGWLYTIAWTISFYPQFLTNIRRKSVRGLATSFFPINTLGFFTYTLSNILMLYSPVVRREYAARYPSAPDPTVRFNDLAFSLHAFILASLTYSQFFPSIWGYTPARKHERTKPIVWGFFAGCCLSILIVLFIAIHDERKPNHGGAKAWKFLDVTTTLAMVKLVITLVKCAPQALLNYQNKSTKGFAISQWVLDFIGGSLSLVQLGLDSFLDGDGWTGVKGNLVKAGLGLQAIVFDVTFMWQHWVLYKDSSEQDDQKDDDGKEEDDEEGDEESQRRSETAVDMPSTPLMGNERR